MNIKRMQAFFDERAAGWDAGVARDVMERAGEIVAGLDIAPGHCVLDVGCGTGALTPILRERMGGRGFVAATDISINMLREGGKKFRGDFVGFFQSDVARPSFRAGVFDWVLCYSVFPHFMEQRRTVALLAESLKPGGRLAVFHSKSRDDINAFHRQVGGEVGGHELPDDAAMRGYFEAAGLKIERLDNLPDRYLALGLKGAA